MNKSKLNRYVRYIYRKMMKTYGEEKVREQALRIFALSIPEIARIREEKDSTLCPIFKDAILGLCREWGINTWHLTEMIEVIGTPEELEQVCYDLTPLRISIRKLTPRECHRLMGNTDEDFEKMQAAGISNSGLYKLAGNSIVVNCLEGIFTQLFRTDSDCLF